MNFHKKETEKNRDRGQTWSLAVRTSGPGKAEPGVVGRGDRGPPGNHGDLLRVHSELPVADPVDVFRPELRSEVQPGPSTQGLGSLRLHRQEHHRPRGQTAAPDSLQGPGDVQRHQPDRGHRHVSDQAPAPPQTRVSHPQGAILGLNQHPPGLANVLSLFFVELVGISVGRPLELDIKCTETGHCKRTFGIRHSMEFGIRPLEIGIMNSVK